MTDAPYRRLRWMAISFLSSMLVALPISASPGDTDNDGVPNLIDNCTLRANPPAPFIADTDGDGHGNACDGDFNNDCIVDSADLALFDAEFQAGGSDPLYDLNGDASVDAGDFSVLLTLNGSPPGPSACGNCPCSGFFVAPTLGTPGLVSLLVAMGLLAVRRSRSSSGAWRRVAGRSC